MEQLGSNEFSQSIIFEYISFSVRKSVEIIQVSLKSDQYTVYF
jgi:hypothetical protein